MLGDFVGVAIWAKGYGYPEVGQVGSEHNTP